LKSDFRTDSTLRARSASESSAFVAATLGQEQISLLLCRQLLGSPKAVSRASSAAGEPLAALAAPASSSELDSYVVRATNLHLNVVARGRAPISKLGYYTHYDTIIFHYDTIISLIFLQMSRLLFSLSYYLQKDYYFTYHTSIISLILSA
jgi:hypothetical protein